MKCKYVLLPIVLLYSTLYASTIYQKPLWSINTTQPVIALTFDDGPKPEITTHMLRLLDQYHVRATFFIVGKQAKLHKDFIKQISDSHHDIGNHSYSHPNLTLISPREVQIELIRTNTILEAITKKKVTFFRPPGGQFNSTVNSIANNLGLKTIFWTINAKDYLRSDTRALIENNDHKRDMLPLADYILQKLKPGSIILLHNGSRETNKALPLIIEGAHKKGYRFITLNNLLTK
ncbi:polysaccharide deacetylase family protein [Candidatus Marinamargulisbacteria bacterium SCGC AAA071-K20]|nr:polysaccharide deacetylase family protein [Candidatus Marinamargulisbacteria bacterium SCGC AAA071-K20]